MFAGMNHEDKVLATIESQNLAAQSGVAASWCRSAELHGLTPSSRQAENVVTQKELNERCEAAESLLRVSRSKLDHLFNLVGSAGCAVVITDDEGLILDHRFNDADADAFRKWGLISGANWSEKCEGTNGIGTCLVEKRNVIIHRDQHFFTKNTGMSCIDTPIYGVDGQVIGALDVSSARADQTEAINKMIAATVYQTAKHIEADIFKSHFPHARIVLASNDETDKCTLLAIDPDDIIIGATRAARKKFGWKLEGDFKSCTATDLFGRNKDLIGFERAERAAVLRALTRSNGNVTAAARDLGVGRATLYRRMKRLGIGLKL